MKTPVFILTLGLFLLVACTTPATPPSNQPFGPPGGPALPIYTPAYNPYARLTTDQIVCLRTIWGDDALAEIMTQSRPPTEAEAKRVRRCVPNNQLPFVPTPTQSP